MPLGVVLSPSSFFLLKPLAPMQHLNLKSLPLFTNLNSFDAAHKSLQLRTLSKSLRESCRPHHETAASLPSVAMRAANADRSR